MTALPRVVLERGRDQPIRGRHPWVFSGAIASVEGDPEAGDEVDVLAGDGSFITRGLYNPNSQIRVRLYSWESGEHIDADFFTRRLDSALDMRRYLGLLDPEDACRLVFSEGDVVSELVVDRYHNLLSVQLTSLALHRDILLDLLEERVRPCGVLLRTENGMFDEEGLKASDGVLQGEVPEEPLPVVEDGLTILVDMRTGQETGHYLDQRDNRRAGAARARGRRVADVCCYTGGFTTSCLRAGAESVAAVDVSEQALALAAANARANGLDDGRVRFEATDAFRWLEVRVEVGDTFELVILDPLRFARSGGGLPQPEGAGSAVPGAARLAGHLFLHGPSGSRDVRERSG